MTELGRTAYESFTNGTNAKPTGAMKMGEKVVYCLYTRFSGIPVFSGIPDFSGIPVFYVVFLLVRMG